MEPPQIKNERYFSHVFQLFVGAKPNSCFLGRKNFVVRKRLTRKLAFREKCACLVKKGACLNNLVPKVPFFQNQTRCFQR